jgi:hypothetical protein
MEAEDADSPLEPRLPTLDDREKDALDWAFLEELLKRQDGGKR